MLINIGFPATPKAAETQGVDISVRAGILSMRL